MLTELLLYHLTLVIDLHLVFKGLNFTYVATKI